MSTETLQHTRLQLSCSHIHTDALVGSHAARLQLSCSHIHTHKHSLSPVQYVPAHSDADAASALTTTCALSTASLVKSCTFCATDVSTCMFVRLRRAMTGTLPCSHECLCKPPFKPSVWSFCWCAMFTRLSFQTSVQAVCLVFLLVCHVCTIVFPNLRSSRLFGLSVGVPC
jgi:hypothetical protein